jgi:hypothetical protein
VRLSMVRTITFVMADSFWVLRLRERNDLTHRACRIGLEQAE